MPPEPATSTGTHDRAPTGAGQAPLLTRLVSRAASTDRFMRVAPKLAPAMDRWAFKVSGGRYMISAGVLPAIMLTTIGARSGLPRSVPLAALPYDGDYIVVGSNFGQKRHPAWSTNLLANPDAWVQRGGERWAVRAERLSDEEVAEVWPKLLRLWPLYDRYVETSGRKLRIFRLRRVPRAVI